MMKNSYKDLTASMKALLWGSVVLTLFAIMGLVSMLIPSIAHGGIFLYGSVISLCFSLILLTILAVKIKKMNK